MRIVVIDLNLIMLIFVALAMTSAGIDPDDTSAPPAVEDLSEDNWSGVKIVGARTDSTGQLALGPLLEDGCKIGSLRSDRVDTGFRFEFVTGNAYDDARSVLADTANFGPGGVVDQEFQLLQAVYDITHSNLVVSPTGSDIPWW